MEIPHKPLALVWAVYVQGETPKAFQSSCSRAESAVELK